MMTWDDLPPDDRDSDTESAEQRERLIEIERRLKAARPTPAPLDAAAWARIVSAAESSDTPEPVAGSPAGGEPPLRRRWFSPAAAAIAAAWLSGVVVGSGVMFMAMHRTTSIAQPDIRQPGVASVGRDLESPPVTFLPRPPLEERPGGARVDEPPSGDARETLATKTFGTMRQVPSTSWLDAKLFEREKPLRPFGSDFFHEAVAAEMPARRQAPSAQSQKERLRQSASQRELARSFVPPPGATPQRVLEELLTGGETLARPL